MVDEARQVSFPSSSERLLFAHTSKLEQLLKANGIEIRDDKSPDLNALEKSTWGRAPWVNAQSTPTAKETSKPAPILKSPWGGAWPKRTADTNDDAAVSKGTIDAQSNAQHSGDTTAEQALDLDHCADEMTEKHVASKDSVMFAQRTADTDTDTATATVPINGSDVDDYVGDIMETDDDFEFAHQPKHETPTTEVLSDSWDDSLHLRRLVKLGDSLKEDPEAVARRLSYRCSAFLGRYPPIEKATETAWPRLEDSSLQPALKAFSRGRMIHAFPFENMEIIPKTKGDFEPNAFELELAVRMRDIQRRLKYWFRDINWLREALSDFIMMEDDRINGRWSNTRLAQLGDKVLALPVLRDWYIVGDRTGACRNVVTMSNSH